ncbi:PKS-NRPS hybrid synthetase [Fusarium oxysporum f. sp. cubense]|uniref:PKS-NRPS hybrid synthetase n=1 Tax=Fusarium oxysporum f. sp. cubense TaxID=61366 RepID=A0A559LXL8_FUSOC|nr:PKS-NRPS hybrid synthetase [Fusarium oxysporum f. sp. cubense]
MKQGRREPYGLKQAVCHEPHYKQYIRTYIRQNSNTIATQQDIYNRMADSKRGLCEDQSTIHAFGNQLDKEGFWNRMQLDSHDRVTGVLFAHPESLAYVKAYPDLLFLDCTYKMNKYGMPLLDIIGVDACQRSFCIAFAFLSGESEEDYTWAFDRLRSMYELCGAAFPSVILTDRCLAYMDAVARCFSTAISLLCLWHANKAVLCYYQPLLTRHDQGPEARRESLNDWNDFFQLLAFDCRISRRGDLRSARQGAGRALLAAMF